MNFSGDPRMIDQLHERVLNRFVESQSAETEARQVSTLLMHDSPGGVVEARFLFGSSPDIRKSVREYLRTQAEGMTAYAYAAADLWEDDKGAERCGVLIVLESRDTPARAVAYVLARNEEGTFGIDEGPINVCRVGWSAFASPRG